MSTDCGMLLTSMQDTCLGVFLNRSLGGANISWERKNFSGCVMGGRKPATGHVTRRAAAQREITTKTEPHRK